MTQLPQSNCNIITLEVKDISYESPKRYEEIDFGGVPPTITQNSVPSVKSNGDKHDLKLRVTVTAKYNDDKDTLFVAEVTIEALVDTTGSTEIEKDTFIEGTAIDIMYNNAREVIGNLVVKGNLPAYQLHFVSHEQNFIFRNKEKFEASKKD